MGGEHDGVARLDGDLRLIKGSGSRIAGKYKKKRCRDYCTASRVISGFCGVLRSNLILPRLPQQFLSLILVLPTVLLLLIYYRSHKKQIHTVGLGIVFPKECILLPV